MKPRSLGFTPRRLTLAREAVGWNRRELAAQTGLSDATISAYELGTRVPTPDNLSALASALDQPVDFFFQPAPPEAVKPLFYRSLRNAERIARQRAQAHMTYLWEFTAYLEQFAHLPPVTLPKIGTLPKNPFDITDTMIDAAADTARKHWKLGDGPVPNIVWMLEGSGVVVSRLDLSSDHLDALSGWSPIDGRPFVILNTTKRNAYRARADIAHELGHLLLHRHLDLEDLTDPATFKLIEEQAWRFAQAFLLPDQAFLRDVFTLSLDALLALKPKWKVSVAFMLHRIHRLGILSADRYTNYRKYLAGRGWLKGEPYDVETDPEQPMMLQEFVDFLMSKELQTPEQIVLGTAYSGQVLEALAQSPPGFFVTPRRRNISFTPKQKVG